MLRKGTKMEPTEVQVVPTPMLLTGLTALLGSTGPFHLPTLSLYQNNATLTRATTLADLTIATFTGYAPVAGLAFSSPYIDVDGSALALGADNVFVATGSAIANVIYGYMLTDAGVANLQAAYALANPVGIGSAGQAVAVAPFLRYSGN